MYSVAEKYRRIDSVNGMIALWPYFFEPVINSNSDLLRQVGTVVHDPGAFPAQPLEQTGIGQDDLRVAVGMWNDVHPHAFPHCVQQIDGHFQLMLDRVEVRQQAGHFFVVKFRVDVKTHHAVQTTDHTGFPDRQQVDTVLRGGQCKRVGNAVPETSQRAHVDACHVGGT